MRIALLQLACGFRDKALNFASVETALQEAVRARANLVVLPEVWNGPYGAALFADFAESVPHGESAQRISSWAKQFKIFLVGGSIAERSDDGRLYNTSIVCGPDGAVVCVHRKVHLFDINVPNGICFKESDSLTAGSDVLSSFEIPGFGSVGLAICYDVRFGSAIELLATQKQCKLLVVPAAFNLTTGPLHWSLLARARAVDNQCYVAMCSPARDQDAS